MQSQLDLLPTPKMEVVRVATPPASVPTPNLAVPLLKITVPAGVPKGDDTVAVKVIDCP